MIVTRTEVEALHLEQNLVKRHRPPFNVRLRDDKSFPYIAVTVRGRVPARHVHARAAPARRRLLRPVREREEGARDARRAEPRLPLPARARGRSRAGTRGIPCLDYHIERCHAPCVGYISKEDYRARDRAGDRVPRRATTGRSGASSSGRCARPRPRSGSRTPRATATGCTRSSGSSERQAADRRSVGDVDVIGIAVDGERATVQVFPLREGRMIDRYSFHLENATGEDAGGGARVVLPRVLRLGAVGAAAGARAGRGRRRVGARGLPLASCAARASRCACRSAARSGGCRSSRSRTRRSRSRRPSSRPRRSGSRRVEALEELREALNLE